MGTKDRHSQKVSSFNPAWCLRPPTVKATTPRNSNINSGNKSHLPSNYRPKKSHRHRHRSPELTVEPTSPRVGCMGQIRRCKAPSGAATGSTHSTSTSPSRSSSVSPQFNLLMLKRGASGSVNTSSSSSSSTSMSSSASPTSVITGEFSMLMLKRVSSTRVTFVEMDPPRPVERKEAKPENSIGLWKRRCGGGGGLQLKLRPMEQISD